MSKIANAVHLLNIKHWFRLLLMIVFSVALYVVAWSVLIIAGIQFLFVLASGELNKNLSAFAQSLCSYGYQIMKFLSYSSDERPFPFAQWP
jgi:hypothetical protein